eukprot:3921953-Prymnesium_polylepis.3
MRARRQLAWPTTSTFLPLMTWGSSSLVHSEPTRVRVSARLSVIGTLVVAHRARSQEALVPLVRPAIVRVARRHRRWLAVKRGAPATQVTRGENAERLTLIQAGQHAVMPLVEAPTCKRIRPPSSSLFPSIQADPRRLDRPLQHACIARVDLETLFVQEDLRCFVGLLSSSVVQRHIRPASEAVLIVPRALAMPYENE